MSVYSQRATLWVKTICGTISYITIYHYTALYNCNTGSKAFTKYKFNARTGLILVSNCFVMHMHSLKFTLKVQKAVTEMLWFKKIQVVFSLV